MSGFCEIEMSYGKEVIILEFSGEYYGIRGHYYVKPEISNDTIPNDLSFVDSIESEIIADVSI